MVREDKVHAAAVNVKGFSQVFLAHGRAFNVPAGPTFAPRAFPERLALLALFPQRKIQGTVLALIHFNAGAGIELFYIFTRELTVFRKSAHIKIHITFHLIGKALFYKCLYHGNHFCNVVGCARGDGWFFHPEQIHVKIKLFYIALGNMPIGNPLFLCAPDDLVVNISIVAHVCYCISPVFKVPVNNIKNNQRARMADVGEVIHRNAAGIHANRAFFKRNEWFLAFFHCVVDLNRH